MFIETVIGGTVAFGTGTLLAWTLERSEAQPATPADAVPGPRSDAPARPAGHADRVRLETLDASDLDAGLARLETPAVRAFKRAFDVAAALGALVFLAPLLVVTALAIKLESPGPVFYRQTRVGLGGQTFRICKFRSMRVDAERDGPRWAEADDNRVTRVGRIIRTLRIDEIPQAFNVLAGEMSFVGPRPERPEFTALLAERIPHYDLRHRVKPGITGWAQVRYHYGASVDDARRKLAYDLYYVERYTPLLDLMILVLTVRVALFGVGAR